MNCNQVVICGRIMEVEGLRYTPAGVAVVELKIGHASHQLEAGMRRRVECEMPAVALADLAETVSRMLPGTAVRSGGFLCGRSRVNRQLVLHLNSIDII